MITTSTPPAKKRVKLTYCCKPFEAHVKYHFFRKADFVGDIKVGMYKDAKWMVGYISIEEHPVDNWALRTPECEVNLAPLLYCPFCGRRLDAKAG